MVALVFPALPTVTLPVTGRAERFPVRRIFCVGRNYVEHAREMGGDDKEPPFFFTKPADAIVESGSRIPYPPATTNLHHEGELVLAIGKSGAMVAEDRRPGADLGPCLRQRPDPPRPAGRGKSLPPPLGHGQGL
jgi:fumarylpyruvate hydrolase